MLKKEMIQNQIAVLKNKLGDNENSMKDNISVAISTLENELEYLKFILHLVELDSDKSAILIDRYAFRVERIYPKTERIILILFLGFFIGILSVFIMDFYKKYNSF